MEWNVAVDRTDIIIFLATLVMMLKIVFLSAKFHRHGTSSAEYLIMARQLTLPLFIVTLTASWYGEVVGVTQLAFNEGIYTFITQGLLWYIAYITFALFFVRRINRMDALTLPEMMQKLIGKKAGLTTAFLVLFKALPITYTLSVGIFLSNLFGFDVIYGMVLGVGLVVFYCCIGGFRAVVFSDLVQFIMMFIAVLLVLYFSIMNYGGLDFLHEHLPATHFEYNGTRDLSQVLIWVFIAFSYTLVSPIFYQRCFAAKNIKIARFGILISVCCWFVFDISITLGGMYARALMPNADSLHAYFMYALDILPVGLKGLFLAGMFCTIVSTLDSQLFIASAVLSYDLASESMRKSDWFRKINIILVGAVSIVIAYLFVRNYESIWLIHGTYVGIVLTIPLIIINFLRVKINDNVFVGSTIATISLTALYDLAPHSIGLHTFYFGLAVNILSLFTFSKLHKLYYYHRYGRNDISVVAENLEPVKTDKSL